MDISALPPSPAQLLAAHLWRNGRSAGMPGSERAVLPTGHAALDALLADGGWPRGALSELLLPVAGIGELPLLLPALAAQAGGGARVVLLSPPQLPCLAGWQAAGIPAARLLLLTPTDARAWLWSAEQAARTPGCALLAWPPRTPAPGMRELRRLQLAAQQGNGLVVLLRDARLRTQSSPAALRLLLAAPARGQLRVEVIKQRGGFGGQAVTLAVHGRHALPRLRPWQLPVSVAAAAHPAAGTSAPAFPTAIHAPEAPDALAGHPLSRFATGPVGRTGHGHGGH
jgi:hypothetical protein